MTVVRRCPGARVFLAAGLLLLLLTACTAVNGVVRTQSALTSAGYIDVAVDFSGESASTIRVRYRSSASDSTSLTREYSEVARVVWTKAPLRFDRIVIEVREVPAECESGPCTNSFDRETLAAQFGPRDPSLDKELGKETGKELLIVGRFVLAAMAIALIIGVTLVLRSRRRSKDAPPWTALPGDGPAAYAPPGGWPPVSRTAPNGPDGWTPPIAPTPHPPAPGYAPPLRNAPAPYPPARGSLPPPGQGQPVSAHAVGAPQAIEDPQRPPPPPPTPTYDIWERPPS